jgi:hypothetical protein
MDERSVRSAVCETASSQVTWAVVQHGHVGSRETLESRAAWNRRRFTSCAFAIVSALSVATLSGGYPLVCVQAT